MPSPTALARQRWHQWWLARLPRSDSLQLTQRMVYILPTGAGWMLALTLLVLLIASINFQLNLGYLLTFLLAGTVAAGMVVSHATLRGLQLHLAPPAPTFLGAAAQLQLQLTNTRRRPRHAVGVSVQGSGQWSWVDVPGQSSTSMAIAFTPRQRGLQAVPVLRLQTRYPLGAFRVWALWRPAAQVLVYPRPEAPAPALPQGTPQPGTGLATPLGGQEEADGVRAYRRGDAQRLIVWKKAANLLATGAGELVSRDRQASHRRQLWLDLAATGVPGTEARLSRLAAWVLQADRLDLPYGLRLGPATRIEPSSGSAQRSRCLQALALHETADTTPMHRAATAPDR
ncbi:DUF58 domain-containing protein [Comamonas faecalis]|uniref:DUF58 domain-containing protein n=1 Tax=Comamonas faecalis TaxID=1387849 RepID=A0ABP7S465_9BURK